MRILMAEEWREFDIGIAIIRVPRVAAGPIVPLVCRQRICRDAEAYEVKDHRLIVSNPVRRNKSALGMPAHRERIATIGHPLPIHTIEDGISERPNLIFICLVLIE